VRVKTEQSLQVVEDATRELLDWVEAIQESQSTHFEKAQAIARQLGAHYRPNGLTQIGFWTPELTGEVMRPRAIYLEVLTPLESVDFRATQQTVAFQRDRLTLEQQGEFFWGVIEGMRPGTREQMGSFYWLRYIDPQNQLQTIRDTLAYSMPYGAFAPAELYDIEYTQKQRSDLAHFHLPAPSPSESHSETIPRVPNPTNILQLHVGTASQEGTLEGLTRIYRQISEKIAANTPLTPAEENYIGYDAVQLLPIEPTIEYRDESSPISEFFYFLEGEGENPEPSLPKGDEVHITLKTPTTQDWGYDVPIMGSSATNPAVLGSLRPDEVVDFTATLHNFSTGSIQVIYDLVYGHADNQSELLLNRQYLKGPNMYGQDLNHQLPTVRAIFLEMERRKINTGADGVRIDGGQDFRFFNPLTGDVEQDDAFLLEMSDVVQEVGGNERLLFTIFEDGRPWPEPGWEEISTYRDLIELKPESYQWGPLIFAHNTPSLKGFWERKWRRVGEVMYHGENWITGYANHDTVRRGNQIDPEGGINWRLGNTLPEVLHHAYDNQAATLWVYGFSPGLPMDFINAAMHAPWMFFRNTDDRYGVKVVSEEIGFLDWQLTPELYAAPEAFPRLKLLGFEQLEQLREFGKALRSTMIETDYHLPSVVQACQYCLGDSTDRCDIQLLKQMNRPGMVAFLRELDIPKLKEFALKFMEDCYEICNVSRYEDTLNPEQTQFNLKLRRFRHAHRWLHRNLNGTDRFNKVSDNQRTIFYGVRSHPGESDKQVAMVAHMGGEPTTVTLGDWLQLDLSKWQVAIASPGLDSNRALADLSCFELRDSQALLLEKIRGEEGVEG
jgi:hypothetical protein